ncbi:acid protease [Artomyces pyxidatus]|uniref:Acid protease n=1 Tax=Artomyces pyxidatus TaxID=48021 RepID=A0ACB8SVC1_9AGAM|nr:acid protease [Artomyces pyxidatus]
MHSLTFYLSLLVLLPSLGLALPHDLPRRELSSRSNAPKRSFQLPIQRRRSPQPSMRKRGTYSGNTGLGDFLDLFYTVPITIGNTSTAVNIDTGSSDLWVTSDACATKICLSTNMRPYPAAQIQPAGGSVDLLYGDSLTGTHASGPVAQDVGTIAGISMPQQAFAAISDTNSTSVMNGANGIFGLGFPSSSQVQNTVVNAKFNNPSTTDSFVMSTASDGPLLSRLAMSGELDQPMFSIMLQRDTIDVSGNNGDLTIGSLPDGIDNSSLTWVPVRLYNSKDGGLTPPTFAPNEIYPLRWEIDIDAVYLDGQKLPESTLTGKGLSKTDKGTVSALIDTGNSLIRGPSDVVDNILSTVSSAYSADENADPTFPCATPHDLSFQIGGKMFGVDPRDFVSQNQTGDATTCIANNIVETDPPSFGALFQWSLGDPFFKSNLVAFYYGNLTNPSVDPPRIGFMSMVPSNADDLLRQEVNNAQAAGGNFESTSQAAPTGTASTTIVATATSVSVPTVVPSGAPAPAASVPSGQNSAQASSAPHVTVRTALASLLCSAAFWIVFAVL